MTKLEHCPFCGSKEAPEYYCGYDAYDCPYHDEDEMIELRCYHGDCKFFNCDKYKAHVVCNVNKGGCGTISGYSSEDAASLWNKRADD